jgi:hypothetical protein
MDQNVKKGLLGMPPTGGTRLRRGYFHGAVIVAVAVVLVVEMAGDEVVGVIAVGNGFVPAAGSVFVAGLVVLTGVTAGAVLGILRTHSDLVFINVVAVHIVHVPIVQKAFMPFMHDRGVATTFAVFMRMTLMDFVAHESSLVEMVCRISEHA